MQNNQNDRNNTEKTQKGSSLVTVAFGAAFVLFVVYIMTLSMPAQASIQPSGPSTAREGSVLVLKHADVVVYRQSMRRKPREWQSSA